MERLGYEQRILEFFSLKLVKVDNTNLYLIKDANDNLVGSLYLTKVDEETFCETMINTDNIAFYKKRNLEFIPSNKEYDYYDSDYYHFLIKSGKDKYDVNIRFSPLDVSISNEKGDFMCLVVNPNRTLYFSSDNKSNDYQMEEIVSVDMISDSYMYSLNGCQKSTGEKESILFSCGKDEKCKDRELCLSWELAIKDRPFSFTSERCYVETSMIEVVKGHKLGVLSFKNLMQRLEQIIPGITEVIRVNISDDSELSMFMNEFISTKRKDLKF